DRTVMDTGMHPDMAGPIVGDIAAGGEPSGASQHHSVACTFPIAVRRIGSTQIERACPTQCDEQPPSTDTTGVTPAGLGWYGLANSANRVPRAPIARTQTAAWVRFLGMT